MRKVLNLIVVFAVIVMLTGCVTVQKVVRERVDQDVSGNRGYLKGSGTQELETKKRTREYIDVRVELPTLDELKSKVKVEEAETPQASYEVGEPDEAESMGQIEGPATSKTTAQTTYKVKDGDSLSIIAKKFYGKASKWTIIYEANIDKIKDPERIKPGTELFIPGIEEEESKYIK